VRKIISILLALGLVLGLTVMATPASAQCTGTSVTNCAVVVTPNVECEFSTYNITFTTTSSLEGAWDEIVVTFPASANISAVVPANVRVNGLVPTFVIAVGDNELRITPSQDILAGTAVRLDIPNVANPTPVGTYTLSVKTTWDVCPCTASFTILTGGSIVSTALWCPCHNVTTTITWGGSTNITEVNGWAWGTGLWAVVGNTLSINCSAMAGLGLNACAVIPIQVNFDPGCNKTLTVTIADNATVNLVAGWNLISLPIMPIDTDIEDVLASIDADVEAVWYYNGCEDDWYAYKNGAEFGLETMEAGKSYWVCMTAAATLNLCGYKLPCPPGAPPCYCYCHCWNMVGFHSTNSSMTLSQYLANLNPAGSLFAALTWSTATGWVQVNAGTTMTVGQGYWMAFTADACFAPPV
jgi:hypothetical protein